MYDFASALRTLFLRPEPSGLHDLGAAAVVPSPLSASVEVFLTHPLQIAVGDAAYTALLTRWPSLAPQLVGPTGAAIVLQQLSAEARQVVLTAQALEAITAVQALAKQLPTWEASAKSWNDFTERAISSGLQATTVSPIQFARQALQQAKAKGPATWNTYATVIKTTENMATYAENVTAAARALIPDVQAEIATDTAADSFALDTKSSLMPRLQPVNPTLFAQITALNAENVQINFQGHDNLRQQISDILTQQLQGRMAALDAPENALPQNLPDPQQAVTQATQLSRRIAQGLDELDNYRGLVNAAAFTAQFPAGQKAVAAAKAEANIPVGSAPFSPPASTLYDYEQARQLAAKEAAAPQLAETTVEGFNPYAVIASGVSSAY